MCWISDIQPSEARIGETLDIDIYGRSFTESTSLQFLKGKHIGPYALDGYHYKFVPAAIEVNDITFIKSNHIKANITVLENAEADGSHGQYHSYHIFNCLCVTVPDRDYFKFPFKIVE